MSDATRPPAGSPLATKLAAVMGAVKRVPKRGTNQHFNYKFAKDDDVATAIRKELSDRGVMLYAQVDGCDRYVVGKTSNGAEKALTTLRMTFTFVDGESGDAMALPWLGCGLDTEDKGIPKAMTSGEKYFLLKTFLVPTGDESADPDAAGPIAEGKARRTSQGNERAGQQFAGKGATPGEKINGEMVARLRRLLKQHNMNEKEFGSELRRRTGATKWGDIKVSDFDKVCRAAQEGWGTDDGAQQDEGRG